MKKGFDFRFLGKACFLVVVCICSLCLSTISWAMVKSSYGSKVRAMNNVTEKVICGSDSVSIVR